MDNPHAFPNITPDMCVDGGPGMTLRDYFAAKAMQGEIAASTSNRINDVDDLASFAYRCADAMLKARQTND